MLVAGETMGKGEAYENPLYFIINPSVNLKLLKN